MSRRLPGRPKNALLEGPSPGSLQPAAPLRVLGFPGSGHLPSHAAMCLPPPWPQPPLDRLPTTPDPWLVRPGHLQGPHLDPPMGGGAGRFGLDRGQEQLEGVRSGPETSWEPLRPLPRSVSPAERTLWAGLLAAAAVDLGIPVLLQGPAPGLPEWSTGYLQAMHNAGWRSTFALMAALSALRGGP